MRVVHKTDNFLLLVLPNQIFFSEFNLPVLYCLLLFFLFINFVYNFAKIYLIFKFQQQKKTMDILLCFELMKNLNYLIKKMTILKFANKNRWGI